MCELLTEVTKENAFLITEFCQLAGDSLKTFRYFNSRSLDVIGNHIITYVDMLGGKPVSYGHLDKEGSKVWLGVCVIKEHIGRGKGKKMVNALVSFAKRNGIKEIHLSVDRGNVAAISLYEKLGFAYVSGKAVHFMKLSLCEE